MESWCDYKPRTSLLLLFHFLLLMSLTSERTEKKKPDWEIHVVREEDRVMERLVQTEWCLSDEEIKKNRDSLLSFLSVVKIKSRRETGTQTDREIDHEWVLFRVTQIEKHVERHTTSILDLDQTQLSTRQQSGCKQIQTEDESHLLYNLSIILSPWLSKL